MSYIALYRKWRPSVFEDVVEQEHVVKTLKHSVVTGRIAHAYLFCGTRGTGKTTMAKIFSRAINCLNPKDGDPCNQCEVCKGILTDSILDVIEIDAASNNSVDNVREIRDEVIYAPSQAKYKVYIIDEVHMLSTGAFNALLKTLEEPPAHVVFILATTDPHKLPATILSRCQRYDFRRISIESIMGRLDMIAQESGVSLEKDAAKLIAKLADGALRDGISVLDQCISMGGKEITYKDVLSVVGIVNDAVISSICDAVSVKDVKTLLSLVDQLVMDGKDIPQFVSDLVFYFRNLLLCSLTDHPEEIVETSPETLESMKSQCRTFERDELISMIKELSSLESSLKWAGHPRILLEVTLIRLSERSFRAGDQDLSGRLDALEKKLASGDFVSRQSEPAPAGRYEAAPLQQIPKEKASSPKSASSGSKPASTPVTDGQALKCWDEIIADLKKSGRMSIFTNLIGTRAIELDSKFIGIVFGTGSNFNKMLVSKTENLEVVEAAASKAMGREIRVKCITEGELVSSSREEKAPESDPFMDKAKEIADRFNVPFNVIDE